MFCMTKFFKHNKGHSQTEKNNVNPLINLIIEKSEHQNMLSYSNSHHIRDSLPKQKYLNLVLVPQLIPN